MRRPGAGHAGAIGNRHRCDDCNHVPGPRRINMQSDGAPAKKSCSCECHQKAAA